MNIPVTLCLMCAMIVVLCCVEFFACHGIGWLSGFYLIREKLCNKISFIKWFLVNTYFVFTFVDSCGRLKIFYYFFVCFFFSSFWHGKKQEKNIPIPKSLQLLYSGFIVSDRLHIFYDLNKKKICVYIIWSERRSVHFHFSGGVCDRSLQMRICEKIEKKGGK